ncbi:hypothetical protein ZIOFF_055340 [Zingiber officinale]|uniref:Cation-transporting P-type ATPase N-terminal domain-containing protein n=1 Tax=Zingiber officinale TaxID=94328 RepID=A0A8J5FHA8_ZINOF|nr:hypothetical protein ZIOFF_055340 [Zingiber officinale]
MGESVRDFELREYFPAWARSASECELELSVSADDGLDSEQVSWRREIYGWNELEKHPGPSIWRLILDQFRDTLVRILLGAAVVSFFLAWFDGNLGESGIAAFVEPLVIFLILIVNAAVGVWQENNAEKALEALKEIQSEHATVKRDGEWIPNLPARELVPGDIVQLRVGDKSEDTDVQGKECMVFAGTTVVNGSCVCLVTQTGMDTEIGKIHLQIHEASQCDDETPLKKKLNEFGELLTTIIGVICALVWLINVKYFFTWEYDNGWPCNFRFSFEKCTYYFKIAVALAVAAIPEGLPAVITTCLALGTRKMAQKNALVRRLPSVETLGCTTVICSDKTGTLTTNQMSAVKIVAMGHQTDSLRAFIVEGTTYDPDDGEIHGWPADKMDENLQMIAKIAAVCNDANISQSAHQFVATGMPTEAALKVEIDFAFYSFFIGVAPVSVLVEKMGIPSGFSTLLQESSILLRILCLLFSCSFSIFMIATLEFDRVRKSMGVIVNSELGNNSLLVKGAVENLLERSSYIQLLDGSVVRLDESSRNLVLEALHEMSTNALRCIGFAYKTDLSELATYDGEDHPAHRCLLDPSNYSSIESDLTFVGFVGLRDPPREEVREAIKDCREAGIRVIVITGDNKGTAEAICREIGVFGPDEDINSKSFIGKDFMLLPDRQNILRQKGGLLFSRAEPKHKQEIVRLLKEDGEVVAMTGDGVNDAPALKLADIGIAMGISGTEVAKEASDMILADDNFSTIVAAVGEGRSIYNNMKAFIRYMISSNIGEVASIFLTAALGIPEGLIPVQLLWVNLVTDGPPATALGFNPPDRDIMKKPPRRTDDPLINAWILFRYLVIGLYVGIATAGVSVIWYTHGSFMGIDLSGDGHTLVSYSQLADWGQCSTWEGFQVSPFNAGNHIFSFDENPCNYFQSGKVKATTLSLSVLVAIEMFNSLNALSEDGSLITMHPWANPWLLLAMCISFGLHFLILYVPFLTRVFGIVPLSFNEWLLVLVVAFPVILIDEILKLVGRWRSSSQLGRSSRRLKID